MAVVTAVVGSLGDNSKSVRAFFLSQKRGKGRKGEGPLGDGVLHIMVPGTVLVPVPPYIEHTSTRGIVF